MLALCVGERAKRYGLHGGGVVLKLTYTDMKSITRSKRVSSCDNAVTIYQEAVHLLEMLPERPVRLIGAGIYDLSAEENQQLTFEEIINEEITVQEQTLHEALYRLQQRYRLDFAGNLEKIYRLEILHRTVEYMRRHKRPENI